ncbi:hypothetical protein P4C99_22055, partial [Pontiellaceae bacterium B1224]|nr:hypothetical protein [Pontiellaceae bacterium B1224]
LEDLVLLDVSVKDLSPLKDSPIQTLTIFRSQIKDVSPLLDTQLENLMIDSIETITNLNLLRSMETLTRINEEPAAVFWKEYDESQSN